MATTQQAMTLAFDRQKAATATPDYLLGKDAILRKAVDGDLSCQFLAGWGFYEARFGFPFDPVKANEWLKKAFVEHKPAGECAIGFCHQHGAGNATKQDLELAKTQYCTSTDYLPAKFLFVAITYAEEQAGRTLPEAVVAGRKKHLLECVEAGFPPAQALLGKFHITGHWGVEHNVQAGLDLLEKAAKCGDGPSQSFLAKTYIAKDGQLAARDLSKAREFIRMAVNQGQPVGNEELKLIKKPAGCTLV